MSDTIDLNNNQSNVVQNVSNLVSNVVNQYIVRPTGDIPSTGISGFVFDVVAEEEVVMESEVTDHYVEDNYAVQDHVAQKPIMFTVKGFVAEISDIFPNTLLTMLTTIQALAPIGSYSTQFTTQANQVYNSISNAVSPIANYIAQAKNIYSILTNASTTATKQQAAYQTFKNFWLNRQLCTVETPFEVLTNMLIMRVAPMQDEMTRLISQFIVTFKQIRTVSTQTISPVINNPAGSGTTTPAASNSIPASPSTGTGILEQSFNNMQNNSLGRVSQNLSPTNILGQTSGDPADIGTLATAFSI